MRVAASAQDRMELQKLRGALGGFGMGGIPGFFGDGGRDPAVRVDFWPGRVEQAEIRQQMVLDGLDAFDIAVVEGGLDGDGRPVPEGREIARMPAAALTSAANIAGTGSRASRQRTFQGTE